MLDSDRDSLDNIREMIEGTDPYIADSDGDGVLDGEEVAIGSDPLDEYERTQEELCHNCAQIELTGTNNLLSIWHYMLGPAPAYPVPLPEFVLSNGLGKAGPWQR